MSTGKIEIIFGDNGAGKTALALGKAMRALTRQKDIIVIQFLKGKQKQEELEMLKRLEPELKVFRFEKSDSYFEYLSEEEKQEELINIRNGLNYAKKVLATGECDLLVLDEILGLLDLNILMEDELISLLECRDEADVILTGQVMPHQVEQVADRIEKIEYIQVDNS